MNTSKQILTPTIQLSATFPLNGFESSHNSVGSSGCTSFSYYFVIIMVYSELSQQSSQGNAAIYVPNLYRRHTRGAKRIMKYLPGS